MYKDDNEGPRGPGRRVDIMKLNYSDDYGSAINRNSARRGKLSLLVQYLMFLGILLVLESVIINSFRSDYVMWLYGTSAGLLLIVTMGVKLFGSYVKAITILCISLLVIFALYYL